MRFFTWGDVITVMIGYGIVGIFLLARHLLKSRKRNSSRKDRTK